MRCALCDKPAIPQAVGRFLPSGTIVFGWCVACMEEAGCREIEPARRTRRTSTRLVLRRRSPVSVLKERAGLVRAWTRTRRRPIRRPRGPIEARRQAVAAVAVTLALWGLVLLGGGLILHARQHPAAPNPMGNGTPALLIGGGGATTAFGIGLLASCLERRRLRPAAFLSLVHVAGLLAALGLLSWWLLKPTPILLGCAVLSLVVSAAASRIRLRQREFGSGEHAVF